jgi:hypothetical protein
MVKRALVVLLLFAGFASAGVRVANPDLLKELSPSEQSVLAKQGMVARATNRYQMHDIYKEVAAVRQPVLVTTDVMLHSFHVLYDNSLRAAELDHFYPAMERVLDGLLRYEQARYAAEKNPVVKQALLENVVYLSVPLSYLRPEFEVPKSVAGLVQAERALIDANSPAKSAVMGYAEDFTQYKPRGHYTRNESFRRYFRAMMYVGRMTFRLPFARDTVLGIHLTRRAVLLAEAMESAVADSGMSPKELWRQVYETTTYLVGSSDDILPDQYYVLARRLAGDVSLATWVAADSNVLRFCRAAVKGLARPRILSDIVPVAGIPAGMRLMGQRYIPDSHIFHNLTHGQVPNRFMPMGLDVMAVLGSDRARSHLVSLYHQDRYSGYLAKLDSMRAVFAGLDSAQWNQNAYSGWLYVLKLNLESVEPADPTSILAGFVRTEAYADKTLVSTCGSWTQLRHDTVLYSKPHYAGGILGGNPPVVIAYVEPKPAVFRQLARLGTDLRGRLNGFGALNPEIAGKLTDFASAATRLAKAAQDELSGVPMSAEDAAFCKDIGRLQERLVTFGAGFSQRYLSGADSPVAPSWADLMAGRTTSVQVLLRRTKWVQKDVDKGMAIVADVHTDPNSGRVLEEAVGNPCRLYAVIPFYGEQYLAVGACFSYYEFTKPMSARMTDEEWQALSPKPPMPVWTKSFIVTE